MISLLLYLFSSLCCVISANLIKNDPVKIIDIVHHNLPFLNVKYLSDFLVLSEIVLAVTLIDKDTLSELFFIMGITQFFRALCSLSTVLPPLKSYSEKIRLGGINGTGTEYIFSGHASYSAISAIYLYKKEILNFPFLFFYNLVSQFCIIITRNHYTVEIVLAWIIVPLIWGNVYLCKNSTDCFDSIKIFL